MVQTFPPSVLTQEKGKQVSTQRLVPTCAGRLQKTRVHQEVDGEANWNFPAAECRSAAEGLGDGCTLHQGNYPHTGLRDGARPRQHTVRSQVYGSPGPVSRPMEQPRCMDHQERQVAEGLPRKRRPHGDVSAMWTVPVDSRVHTGCQTVPSNVNDMSVKLLRKILEIVQVLFNLERLAAPAGSAGYSPASAAAVAVAAVKISKLYLSVKGSSNKPKAMSALFFPRSGRQDPEQKYLQSSNAPSQAAGSDSRRGAGRRKQLADKTHRRTPWKRDAELRWGTLSREHYLGWLFSAPGSWQSFSTPGMGVTSVTHHKSL